MVYLVELDAAKNHLRVDGASEDATILVLIAAASEVILDYLKMDIPTETSPDTSILQLWDTGVVPGAVQSATLLLLGDLYENREGSKVDILSSAVKALLHPHRDPALA